MPQMDAFLLASTYDPTKTSPLTGASTAELTLTPRKKYAFNAIDSAFNGAVFHLKFGIAGMAAADAGDMAFSGGTPTVLQIPSHITRVRIFNPEAGTIDTYIWELPD